MTMTILDLTVTSSAPINHTNEFKAVLEDHMSFLRSHVNTETLEVKEAVAYRYEGDFYGLLTEHRVDNDLHWITMRMNGLTSTHDFDGERTLFLLPDRTTISAIRQFHQTKNSV